MIEDRQFQVGDSVILAEGPYQGTAGVFVKLGADPNWADITERNGRVRSHAVRWLRHEDSAVAPA
jgi:hypothetical protein